MRYENKYIIKLNLFNIEMNNKKCLSLQNFDEEQSDSMMY